MGGVQADRYLHALRLANRLKVAHVHAEALLQSRTSVREPVLNDQVLGPLSVGKGGYIGPLARDHRLHIRNAHVLQIPGNLLGGTGGDLVDHRRVKGHVFFPFQPIQERLLYKSARLPGPCHGQDGFPQQLTVSGAVVHGHQRHRRTARQKAFAQHGRQDAHGTDCPVRAARNIRRHIAQPAAVRIFQGISLFRNGEGHQLQ